MVVNKTQCIANDNQGKLSNRVISDRCHGQMTATRGIEVIQVK